MPQEGAFNSALAGKILECTPFTLIRQWPMTAPMAVYFTITNGRNAATMSQWRDNLQMFGPPAAALLLLIIAVGRYIILGRWEHYFATLAWAVFGFVSAVASDEVADWTGRYGWTSDSYWTYPPTWVRAFGLITLVLVNLFGFRN